MKAYLEKLWEVYMLIGKINPVSDSLESCMEMIDLQNTVDIIRLSFLYYSETGGLCNG